MAVGGRYTISQRPLCHIEIAREPQTRLAPISGYETKPLVSIERAIEELIDILPKIQFYADVAKQNYENSHDGLTKDETIAIMLYTMSWNPPEHCLYFVLNKTLRSSNRKKLEPWYLYLRLLFNGLFRLPPISSTIYRGVKSDLSDEYTCGKKIIWWGFSSCTQVINILKSEQFLGETGVRTMFVIQCHSGRNIHKHSFFPFEQEILLLPATQFEVTGYLIQNDLIIITLEEIQPCEPLLRPISVTPILADVYMASKRQKEEL